MSWMEFQYKFEIILHSTNLLDTFRIRVPRSDDEAHLRLDRVDRRGVVDHDDQVAGSLVVESEVLGEGLTHHHLEAAILKIPAQRYSTRDFY